MIETFFTFSEIDKVTKVHQEFYRFEAAVVIDVLRATSTMITALSNSASAIIPVSTINEAFELKKTGFLICGERKGLKPKGFDLGNSPLEFKEEVVNNRKIVLTTTNGTKALLKAMILSDNVYIGAFLNISALVKEISHYKKIAIVCAGNNGKPSYEDTQLAGFIIKKLMEKHSYELTDTSKIAYQLWNSLSKPDFTGSHAKKLIQLGFQKDVEFCKRTDLFKTIGKFDGNNVSKV
ncbi:MAG: 2-phosphosulfolactate phosphatase [Fervidobacterium sp.]